MLSSVVGMDTFGAGIAPVGTSSQRWMSVSMAEISSGASTLFQPAIRVPALPYTMVRSNSAMSFARTSGSFKAGAMPVPSPSAP